MLHLLCSNSSYNSLHLCFNTQISLSLCISDINLTAEKFTSLAFQLYILALNGPELSFCILGKKWWKRNAAVVRCNNTCCNYLLKDANKNCICSLSTSCCIGIWLVLGV